MKRLMFVMFAMIVTKLWAYQTEVVDGIEWKYDIVTDSKNGDYAMLYGGFSYGGVSYPNSYYPCIPTDTVGDIIVPASLGGKPVKGTKSYAFSCCGNITSIDMTLCSISDLNQALFVGCTNLKRVILPKTLTSFVSYTQTSSSPSTYASFYGCNLDEIIFRGALPGINKWSYETYGVDFGNNKPKILAYYDTNPSFSDIWRNIGVKYICPSAPTINPSECVFEDSLTISISASDTKTEKMFYTLDGYEPTTNSTLYEKKFRIYKKTTMKAIAYAEGMITSEVATVHYALGTCADPTISPSGETTFYHSNQRVSIGWHGDEGTLYYTLDGSEPTTNSTKYTGSFTISDTTTIKARAISDLYFDSSIVSATLTRLWEKVGNPTISPSTTFTGTKSKFRLATTTQGASIYYTLDGSEPTTQSTKYESPILLSKGCTIKAKAVLEDYLDSDVVTFNITKEWVIGDTMGKPDHKFETSGDVGFGRVVDTTATLGESMKSGGIGDSQVSILLTTVVGPGTITFKWKASCEDDDEYEWDHGEFWVDGGEQPKARIKGETDWIEVSQRIEGEGEHTLEWKYVKDDVESVGQDCMWVSDYDWDSDFTTTQTTQVPVPYDWLLEKCVEAVDEYEVLEKIAKQNAENPSYTVEGCYVSGLNPESPTNNFSVVLAMRGDETPNITWNPDLKSERKYKIWGSETMEDGGDWQYPTNSLHRFFKVSVGMP